MPYFFLEFLTTTPFIKPSLIFSWNTPSMYNWLLFFTLFFFSSAFFFLVNLTRPCPPYRDSTTSRLVPSPVSVFFWIKKECQLLLLYIRLHTYPWKTYAWTYLKKYVYQVNYFAKKNVLVVQYTNNEANFKYKYRITFKEPFFNF